ncbi:MFS transporter [Paenibacillus kobensis]|uniref:MFS transporter n=1 Tax=Paenibacillus kobensis TaxID=59841 RepID=UPI000FD7A67C|nr:MFS transporter [Paenibacillus kobensis]
MLQNKFVRTIMLSSILLQLGIWVRNFAILLFVTAKTDNDPLYVSLISVAEFAPIFLFSFIGGAFADRWRPKRTMVWSSLLSALSAGAVLIVVALGSWQALFAATFISAMLSQFSQPSAMKLFKQHVQEEKLQSVMAMYQTVISIFLVIGPAVGAFVYDKFGLEISLAVMGGLLLGSAIVLSLLPSDERESDPSKESAGRGSLLDEMKDGLRYVGRNPLLRTLAIAFTAAGLAAGLIQPLSVFVAVENLGKDSSFLQWVIIANGAAMMVGGAVIMTFAQKVKPQALLTLGLLVSAAGTVAVGWSTSVTLTLVLQAMTGLFYPCIHIGIQTLILRNTEPAYIGRVGGTVTPIFMGMMVIGMSVGGVLKHATSLFSVFAISGVLFFVGAMLMLPTVLRQSAVHSHAAQR